MLKIYNPKVLKQGKLYCVFGKTEYEIPIKKETPIKIPKFNSDLITNIKDSLKEAIETAAKIKFQLLN